MNDIVKRAFKEKSNAEKWFNGYITEQEAKNDNTLNPEMVDYWFGILYEKQERATHGYS